MSDAVQEIQVDEAHVGFRLDTFLAGAIGDASRSFIKKLIKDGRVTLNGAACARPSRSVALDDCIAVSIPPPEPCTLEPENIPLDILHEDGDLVVVNKPSGLVVHPAPGHRTGTLVHAVLYHCADFRRDDFDDGDEGGERPGIVHRLDQFTSGVMVVAKTRRAFDHLSAQAREHSFDRRYRALVRGAFKEDVGKINATIGRSLKDRTRMTVTSVKGREAITRVATLERFGPASLVALTLETGRTHQIRVHLRFAGHPVLGDPVYGVTDYSGWTLSPGELKALKALDGQALHAELLGLEHPATGERLTFTAPAPTDFQSALDALRNECDRSATI